MKSTVERAFELARGGTCRSIEQIRYQLAKEHFSNIDGHLSGLSIRTELKALLVTS